MAAFSFATFFKHTALVALIAFLFVAVSDGCTFKSDCEENQVCCNYGCVDGSNCIGQCCSSDSDCSSWETCCSHSCVVASSCFGRYCSSDSDCSGSESCCSSVCIDELDCSGYSCSKDSDCGNKAKHCCDGQCSNKGCHDTAATIGIIIGVICLISMCIVAIGRCLRSGQRGTATTVPTTGAIQSNPPHQGQVPPSDSYQQGYPHHPPQQQHTTNLPPHNPEVTTASEQPPPYTAAPQGVSGGVYAPKPSYGAIPLARPV
ncbi:uncharacterized protein LOC144628559 [Oculina patagonica]